MLATTFRLSRVGWRGLAALQGFESVPRRWPLARLTVPLLNSVDYIDRVLAGCCWEVLITRQDPNDSALRQAARSLTLTVACYLSEFVADTLRASIIAQGGPLTDTIGSNPSIRSCYMRPLGTMPV